MQLRPPPPIPQCHQGNQGAVGGVHTPVTLASPACPLASSRRTRVVLEEEEECTCRCIGEVHAAVLVPLP